MQTYQCSNGHRFNAIHSPASCPVGACGSRLIAALGGCGCSLGAGVATGGGGTAVPGAPSMGQMSARRRFLVSFWIGIGGTLTFSLLYIITQLQLFLVLVGLDVSLVVAMIFATIALYQAWKTVQPLRQEYSAMAAIPSPGKAVGFLFIPLFHLYWLFIAIAKLPRAVNLYAETRNIPLRQMNPGVASALCILIMCICSLMGPLTIAAMAGAGNAAALPVMVVLDGLLDVALYVLGYIFILDLYAALIDIERQS